MHITCTGHISETETKICDQIYCLKLQRTDRILVNVLCREQPARFVVALTWRNNPKRAPQGLLTAAVHAFLRSVTHAEISPILQRHISVPHERPFLPLS